MAVKVEDRFAKADAPNIIWRVVRILDARQPAHAVLAQEGRPQRQITLSIEALGIASIYRKLAPN